MILNIKSHKNYSYFNIQKNHVLQFGSYGFKTLNFLRLSQSQLNSLVWLIKLKIKKLTKKNVKFWILIKPNLTLTKLGLETRMGKGKGSIVTQIVFLKPGTILFEFDNLSMLQILKLLKFINKKCSSVLKLVSRLY
nr:ribosomal protein L16 [Ceramothamnion sp.]